MTFIKILTKPIGGTERTPKFSELKFNLFVFNNILKIYRQRQEKHHILIHIFIEASHTFNSCHYYTITILLSQEHAWRLHF